MVIMKVQPMSETNGGRIIANPTAVLDKASAPFRRVKCSGGWPQSWGVTSQLKGPFERGSYGLFASDDEC
jgi:hypothetical protein